MANNSNLSRTALAALLLGLAATSPRAEHIAIVATVNDVVITSTDLADRRALLLASSNLPDNAENEQRVTPRVLQSLIDEALEMQEAKRQSITISDDEVQKILDNMPASKNDAPGTLKPMLIAKGLPVRSLETQIRAQLAWQKVVQRKLRRNVTVSRDELVRAQQMQAADPGTVQARVTAIAIATTGPDAALGQKAVDDIGNSIKQGQDLGMIGDRYTGHREVKVTPPLWVNEETLPVDIEKVLQGLKPGETSAAFESGNATQFVKLLDRKTVKKTESSTEVTLKQIAFDVPAKPAKPQQAKISETERVLHANPGSCEDATLPAIPLPAEVKFTRVKLGELSTDQRNVVSRLGVGDVSDPLATPGKVRLIQLCERVESAGGNAELETIRKELFAEKMDLEAQKHLRNLRRDASIDIRDDSAK